MVLEALYSDMVYFKKHFGFALRQHSLRNPLANRNRDHLNV